jgi:hypothetical protein
MSRYQPQNQMLTKIGRWFLVQIKEIVDFEEELRGRRIEFGCLAN